MVKINVPGRSLQAAGAAASEDDLGVSISVKDAVLVDGGRGAGETKTIEAADADLVELTLEGGVTIWVRADELESQLGRSSHRGGESAGVFTIDGALALDDSSRGLGAWVINTLRVLGIDLAGKAASEIAVAFEEKVVPKPGLYHWDGDNFDPFKQRKHAAQPWLLFLHGTASNTEAGFGDLPHLQKGLWAELSNTYGERIIAFEHRTLTVSPIANALALLQQLPKGIELHVISHSRGGLVGELLGRGRLTGADGQARMAFDDAELRLFEAPGYEHQHAEVVALNKALSERQVKVSRFVRVAAPARGTSLMGGRIDRWLNMVFNVAGMALGGRLNPVTSTILDGLRTLVQATVKERTDPKTLPGLAAMSPEFSPLLQVLNRKLAQQADDLFVIGGDIEPSGVLRRLAIWFADMYFGQDHDLVVDTASMDGGTPRLNPPRVYTDRSATASHFNYFANAVSVGWLQGILVGRAGAATGGTLQSRAAQAPMPTLRGRGAGELSVVFVLPGITGSHLKEADDRIWLDIFDLARGKLAQLDIHNLKVAADEPIAMYYGRLCKYLDASHDVRAWAYDWRRSILETASRFGKDLHSALDDTSASGRSVRIVAHSMGGLVARTAFALDAELWRRFKEREGNRLVMLGTPSAGSYSIPMMLFGRDKLMQYLAMLDITANAEEHLEIVAQWPGVLQMLPEDSEFLKPGEWERLKQLDPSLEFPLPTEAALEEARRFREVFNKAPIDSSCMFYIAGQADTYSSMVENPEADEGQRLRFAVSQHGDGRVMWNSGIPKGVKTWYAAAEHGDLARHEPALPAILELLQMGTTNRLPSRPPALRGRRGKAESIERERVAMIPSEEEVLSAAMGGRVEPQQQTRQRVKVSVKHGHLAYASYPVLAGHYLGDTLNGTERVLDRRQNGRLSKRRRLGIYPGAIETCDVFIDEKLQPQGSLVVGLGETSELTRGNLKRTLQHGLLNLAASRSEYDEIRRQNKPDAFQPLHRGVSCLLVGSGEGVVALEDCVTAILLAVQQANRLLDESIAYESVEIVELVEQQAVNAWHALRGRLERAEFSHSFVLDGRVKQAKGAWRRIGPERDATWWTPITITADKQASGDDSGSAALKYVVIAGRARAEASLVAARRCQVDRYLDRVTQRRVEKGPMSVGRTLFELLWPNRLKEQSLDDRNIRLILDDSSAALPWEMMDDQRPWEIDAEGGSQQGDGPPAVRSGVVRQLISQQLRESIVSATGSRRALVIGDPRGEDSGLPELPGAQEEAKAVQKLLEAQGYDVTPMIGDGWLPEDVISALLGNAWQIVHIAAHGVVDHAFATDACGGPQTGIVIGGGLVIDAELLEQMPVVPELFFVNCCLLGSIDTDKEKAYLRSNRPALASSVAVQLIRMGVRAVIAAGWEVTDSIALRFATSVYQGMLDRQAFGKVVRDARAEIYRDAPHDSTWGAYQCYGEPDFRLPGGSEVQRQANRPPEFALIGEAISQIERIAAMAEVADERNRSAPHLAEIGRMEETIAAYGWMGDARVRSALATAYAQLGQFDTAIAHYAAAAVNEDASAPVKAIEQHLNLVVRQAADRAHPEAASEIQQSIRALKSLASACGDTLERLSLVGASYKRLAWLSKGAERTKALKEMGQWYRKARKIGQQSRLDNTCYPWSQELTATIVESIRSSQKASGAAQDFDQIRQLLRPDSEDFWLLTMPADLTLLESVADGKLGPEDRERVKNMYLRVWRHTGSDREASSVLEQFHFLIAMLEDSRQAKVKLLIESLQALVKEISDEITA